MLCFFIKIKKTDIFLRTQHFDRSYVLTQLSSKAEISVLRIVCFTKNFRFVNDTLGCLIFQVFKAAYRTGYEDHRLIHHRSTD
jgi:hypothetical protein